MVPRTTTTTLILLALALAATPAHADGETYSTGGGGGGAILETPSGGWPNCQVVWVSTTYPFVDAHPECLLVALP